MLRGGGVTQAEPRREEAREKRERGTVRLTTLYNTLKKYRFNRSSPRTSGDGEMIGQFLPIKIY